MTEQTKIQNPEHILINVSEETKLMLEWQKTIVEGERSIVEWQKAIHTELKSVNSKLAFLGLIVGGFALLSILGFLF